MSILLNEIDVLPASFLGNLLDPLLLVPALAKEGCHGLIRATNFVVNILERNVPRHVFPDNDDTSSTWL